MALLENHLDQISLSSKGIAELPFPPPKIFTNALLHSHDITALIRDTEPHERALFTRADPEPRQSCDQNTASRKSVVFPVNTNATSLEQSVGLSRLATQKSAVVTLLGGEVIEQIRKGAPAVGQDRGELDVELLLSGAAKLCKIYPIAGANDRIASLRTRHEQVSSTIARYGSRISKQTAQLDKMNHQKDFEFENDDEDTNNHDDAMALETSNEGPMITVEDLRKEEDEIRELEKKKRGLEDRVSGMERDLGGLLR